MKQIWNQTKKIGLTLQHQNNQLMIKEREVTKKKEMKKLKKNKDAYNPQKVRK